VIPSASSLPPDLPRHYGVESHLCAVDGGHARSIYIMGRDNLVKCVPMGGFHFYDRCSGRYPLGTRISSSEFAGLHRHGSLGGADQ
jgi:hypothetical protein